MKKKLTIPSNLKEIKWKPSDGELIDTGQEYATVRITHPNENENGYLKTKDKKARKEIKELREELKDLKKAFKILGKIAMVDKSFASTVDVHKLSRFVNNGL